MDDDTKYVLEGRKTFFIVPDVTLFPDTYLEDYLTHGYETYIINDDRTCPLTKKIEAIISVFNDAIFFFYIDTPIQGIEWRDYISELQEEYGDKILIGVLYAKRSTEIEKRSLERYYLFDVGIKCGCISLEYSKAKNFTLIDKVMFANQACGRRKNVRAICDSTSSVNLTYKKKKYFGAVSDVSLSHFSCVFNYELDVPMFEKLYDVVVDIHGMHFKTDSILLDVRELSDRKLYIFIFSQPNGQPGMDPDLSQRLSEKIYKLVTDKVQTLLHTMFIEASKSS